MVRAWPRVVDNGWLRCCDDRCRLSTATSKRHPNPADQCKSILNPRLESSCCHAAAAHETAAAPLPRCCFAVPCCTVQLCSHFSPGSYAHSSTRPLPIREYGEHMERSIAGRRTQGGSCRLARHIHTSARFCAFSVQQLWYCLGILRTAINGFARTAIAAWPHVCDNPKAVRYHCTTAKPSPPAIVRRPRDAQSVVAKHGDHSCNPRGPYNCTRGMDDPDHYSLGQSLPRPLSRPSMPSSCPYTRLSTGSQDKLSAQPFCAPAPGLGLHRKGL